MKDKLTDREFKIDDQVREQPGNKLGMMQINVSIRKQVVPTNYNVLNDVGRPVWLSVLRQIRNSLKMRFNPE